MMMSLCFIAESGTDVRLVEGLAECFDLSILARRINGGVEISQPPSSPLQVTIGPAGRFGFALSIFKHIYRRRRSIDVVLVQGYGLAALAANLICLLCHLPLAMIVCSPAEIYYACRKGYLGSDKPYHRREFLLLKLVARLNSYFGSLYIVLSQHLADIVRSNNRKSSIAVIPVYGVDTRVFKPALEARAVIRERLSLPREGELIFFSSRIAPEKDSETLLQAFKILRAEGRSLWLLHRSGGHKEFLRAAERFGVASRVIAGDAVDPRQELALNYQACDVCVQASRAEGLGFSALEALACNVPVIAAAVGGLKETIVDGQTGWTYPAGDATALAQCIVEVLRERDEAMRRSNNGRGLVVKVYERKQVFEVLQQTLHPALLGSHPDASLHQDLKMPSTAGRLNQ